MRAACGRHDALLALDSASARLARRAAGEGGGACALAAARDAQEVATLATTDLAPRVRLETFVGFLQEADLLPQALHGIGHDSRLRSLACIAQAGFGLDLVDDDDLRWGPPLSLMVDFARIAMEGADCDASFMPASFDAGAFASLVSGKGDAWLGAAALALRLRGSRDPDDVARRARWDVDGCDLRLARQAIGDVEEAMGGERPAWGDEGAARPRLAAALRRCASMLAS